MQLSTVTYWGRFAIGIAILFACPGTFSSAVADTPEAYPGWIWNRSNYDFNNLEGFANEGNVTQGVQWFTLPGGIPTTTFASYRWRLRTLNRPFYDAQGPALGVSFSKYFFNWGVEYEWQDYPQLDRNTRNFSLYLTWFKRVEFIAGFPTTTWGRATDDFNNLEGVGSMGYVSQAVDWFTLPGNVIFRTHALYYWRFRSKNNRFYNLNGPAVGIELQRDTINAGIEYAWLRYPVLQERTHDFRAYLAFYFDWDLKKKAAAPTGPTAEAAFGRVSAL